RAEFTQQVVTGHVQIEPDMRCRQAGWLASCSAIERRVEAGCQGTDPHVAGFLATTDRRHNPALVRWWPFPPGRRWPGRKRGTGLLVDDCGSRAGNPIRKRWF